MGEIETMNSVFVIGTPKVLIGHSFSPKGDSQCLFSGIRKKIKRINIF